MAAIEAREAGVQDIGRHTDYAAHEATISAEGYPEAGAAKRGPAAVRRRRRA
jgi:hypothetical protein